MSDELDGLLAEGKDSSDGFLEKLKGKPQLVSIGLLGVFLLGVGVLSSVLIANKSVDGGVEIMEVGVTEESEDSKIMVDVAGAVFKPGLYELEPDSRINDALLMAGGISLEADRDWFSKNLNLAQKLTDGQKLYIPKKEEVGGQVEGGVKGVTSVAGKININTASISQLDTLWGVGEATANKIVEGRPYSKVEELLVKKVVKANVYERIKDEVVVF